MSLKLSICIEMIFKEKEFLERIKSTAKTGIKAFEFWGWQDKDIEKINSLKKEYELELAAFTGSKTSLTDTKKSEQAYEDIKKALDIGKKLNAHNVIITVGQEQKDISRKKQKQNIINILKKIAPEAEKKNISLVVEPLNTEVNHPGYFLSSSYEGYEIIDAVGSNSVKILFDIYHQQITEGNIIQNIKNHIDYIGHFHLADVPGRKEPGTGELNYKNIFEEINRLNYNGYIGCEFKPSISSKNTIKKTLDLIN